MSKEKEIEDKFDFNIDNLFGGFTPEEGKTESSKRFKEEPEIPLIEEKEEKEEVIEEEESEEVIEEKEEEVVEEEQEDEEIEYSYKAIAQFLAEEGAIDFEDSEDLEDSPEIIAQAVINTARNMVNEYKESISEDGRKFLDYLEKGGKASNYIAEVSTSLNIDDIDLSDEANQKRVIREYYSTQDYTEEEITELLQDYEDGLILEKQANLASRRLKKVYDEKEKQLVKAQEKENARKQEAVEEYIKDIRSTIKGSDSLGGISISAEDKKQFEKYLLERDKSGVSQYEKDLQEDPVKSQLELAFLKFKKFDFSKVVTKAKTEEARRIKGLIKSKNTTVKGASKRVRSSEDAADLSAFNSIF